MTVIEIKNEIKKELDRMPDNVLPDILSYLKQVQQLTSINAKLNQNLKKIFSEDRELLEKLAQ